MTVPGMLDQRIRWYARSGTVINGFSRPAFVFEKEVWGRIDTDGAQQQFGQSPQAKSEVRGTASCTVDMHVTVPLGGIAVVDGTLYWHRGDWVVRDQRVRRVALERIQPEEAQSVETVENAETLGGVQLVEGSGVDADQSVTVETPSQPNAVLTITTSTNLTGVNSGTTILVDATGGAITVTLPVAVLSNGFRYEIKKVDAGANLVTVTGAGAETIDGAADYLLPLTNDAVTLRCNGAAWVVL